MNPPQAQLPCVLPVNLAELLKFSVPVVIDVSKIAGTLELIAGSVNEVDDKHATLHKEAEVWFRESQADTNRELQALKDLVKEQEKEIKHLKTAIDQVDDKIAMKLNRELQKMQQQGSRSGTPEVASPKGRKARTAELVTEATGTPPVAPRTPVPASPTQSMEPPSTPPLPESNPGTPRGGVLNPLEKAALLHSLRDVEELKRNVSAIKSITARLQEDKLDKSQVAEEIESVMQSQGQNDESDEEDREKSDGDWGTPRDEQAEDSDNVGAETDETAAETDETVDRVATPKSVSSKPPTPMGLRPPGSPGGKLMPTGSAKPGVTKKDKKHFKKAMMKTGENMQMLKELMQRTHHVALASATAEDLAKLAERVESLEETDANCVKERLIEAGVLEYRQILIEIVDKHAIDVRGEITKLQSFFQSSYQEALQKLVPVEEDVTDAEPEEKAVVSVAPKAESVDAGSTPFLTEAPSGDAAAAGAAPAAPAGPPLSTLEKEVKAIKRVLFSMDLALQGYAGRFDMVQANADTNNVEMQGIKIDLMDLTRSRIPAIQKNSDVARQALGKVVELEDKMKKMDNDLNESLGSIADIAEQSAQEAIKSPKAGPPVDSAVVDEIKKNLEGIQTDLTQIQEELRLKVEYKFIQPMQAKVNEHDKEITNLKSNTSNGTHHRSASKSSILPPQLVETMEQMREVQETLEHLQHATMDTAQRMAMADESIVGLKKMVKNKAESRDVNELLAHRRQMFETEDGVLTVRTLAKCMACERPLEKDAAAPKPASPRRVLNALHPTVSAKKRSKPAWDRAIPSPWPVFQEGSTPDTADANLGWATPGGFTMGMDSDPDNLMLSGTGKVSLAEGQHSYDEGHGHYLGQTQSSVQGQVLQGTQSVLQSPASTPSLPRGASSPSNLRKSSPTRPLPAIPRGSGPSPRT
mmetsp:Transcript_5230/g.11997  ORF Transcript_5230/g.11997 Transcript_5230/m.11997 type:complete len:925 (+) Transcript_5230:43-2817(+)